MSLSPLHSLLKPVIRFNSAFYSQFNTSSLRLLNRYGHRLPSYVTADFITTGRLGLLPPTLVLWSADYSVLPASLVFANLLLDYVDGAVARWEKQSGRSSKKQREEHDEKSLYQTKLNLQWGAYWDAIADKAFAIPVWSAGVVVLSESPLLQSAFLCHILAESASTYVRTREYFTDALIAPRQDGAGEGTIIASAVGKSKQFLAMTGTCLAMVPGTQAVGTGLVCLAVPLAGLSLYQKMGQGRSSSRTVYVRLGKEGLGTDDLEFLWRARSLGDSLIVGIPSYAEALRRVLRRMAPLVSRTILEESSEVPLVNAAYIRSLGADIVAVRRDADLGEVDATLLQGDLVHVAPAVPEENME